MSTAVINKFNGLDIRAKIAIGAVAFFIGIPALISGTYSLATTDWTRDTKPDAPWVEAAFSDDGSKFFINTDTLNVYGQDRVEAEVIRNYPEQINDGLSYKWKIKFNCNSMNSFDSAGTEYSKRNAQGKVTRQMSGDRDDQLNREGEWKYYVGQAACNYVNSANH